jgi:hypothetical protein
LTAATGIEIRQELIQETFQTALQHRHAEQLVERTVSAELMLTFSQESKRYRAVVVV